MRTWAMGAAVAAGLLAGPAALGAGLTAEERAADVEIMRDYPDRALEKGIQGRAWLKCDRTAGAALRGCTVLAEAPAGWGFGEAALKLAHRSQDNPEVKASPADTVVGFVFCLTPPLIRPNTLLASHVIVPPTFRFPLTNQDVMMAYPVRAATRGTAGRVVLDCRLNQNSKVEDCKVIEESPKNEAFGRGALSIARAIRLRPQTIDGVAKYGRVQVPIDFGARKQGEPFQDIKDACDGWGASLASEDGATPMQ